MAVNTTVQVTMPQMGDSVSEGTVLEWHKKEGDQVSEDEVLVEISTDKVDAEVPAPTAGTVVKIHAAEGDTITVGAILAEIAPAENGAAPAAAAPEEESGPSGETVEIVMPAMGESVTEGTILEWAKEPGESVAEDETIVEISTDKVDAEVPAPASGTIEEILAQAGDTVHVGQVLARMTTGNGAAPAKAKAPEPTSAPRPQGSAPPPPIPDSIKVTPVAARVASALGVDLATIQGSGPAGRISKADVLAAETNGAPAAAERHADQGRERDARALHGRVALGADRDVLPHAHGHDARRPPQAAQGGRPARLLHPPDRLRDRPRRHRADARDGPPFQEIDGKPHVLDDGEGQPRHRRRRRAQGRRAHADGARDPRRRAPVASPTSSPPSTT